MSNERQFWQPPPGEKPTVRFIEPWRASSPYWIAVSVMANPFFHLWTHMAGDWCWYCWMHHDLKLSALELDRWADDGGPPKETT
jgi:hypothetical protein